MTENSKEIRNTFGGIAEQYHQLRRRVEKIERSPADLRNAAIDGGRGLTIKSDAETIRFGDNGVEHLEGPAPEQPEAPFVDLGGESVKVQLSGLDAYGYPAQRNFKQAHIHVSHDDVFEPSRSTFAGYVAQADGSMTHRLPGGEWYVGVVWENMSGALSPMSDTTLADVEPLVDTGDIQDALDEAQERLDTYRDNVAAPRFEALETGLEANATNLDDARTRLSEAESTLSPLPGRISEAEENAQAAQREATTASAAAVEANNRSMTRLANGNFESDLLYWDHDNVELTSTAHSGQQAAQIDGWLRPGSSFPVVADQIWELSLYHQYDVTVEFQAIDGDQRATMSTHHLDGDSSWSDSGALRVTIPADVHMLSFTITGTGAVVDDITLRDVTDVVRLEEAANANRQKAEQAINELAVLQLAVDGEGGLKDRLASAETVLETKADTSALDQLDQKLAGDLAAFEAHYTRVWRQPTPPPPGTSYEWAGTPHASESIKRVDGVEVARNLVHAPSLLQRVNFFLQAGVDVISADGPNDLHGLVTVVGSSGSNYVGTEQPAIRPGQWAGLAADIAWADGIGRLRVQVQFRAADNTSISAPQFVIDRSEAPDGGRFHIVAQAPPGTDFVRPYTWWYAEGNFSHPGDGATVWMDNYSTAIGESESDVLDQLYPHFDGDTESDRANDLWYNQDGVPHEWVNGQGWTVLDDQRITELANTVSAHDTRLQTAETELGKKATTTALNDLAGTVADNTTAISEAQQTLQDAQDDLDTALTGPVDHDRLRAGTGAFNQAFIARLVADSVQAMSAEFEQLTVTELANFARIIGDEIWAELAVFDRLDAREAYIGGAHLKDGAVTAEKMTITGDLAAAIVSADKARIAELISEEVWAELGVFNRLQAREGWIGGTLLADGAVTAEKIHATRELITKIMGAEWAYISERLVVEGDLIAANIDAISASIDGLTVTERADFTKAFAQEMWAELGVFDKLQAQEAWIGGALLKDDTITTRHLEVTEDMVGRFAELLHLVVDRIDVNNLWADQTWQAAGHFGSEQADQSTLVDGTGLRITKHDHQNETSTDIVRLGGEGIGLTFFDEETGEVTGSQSPEGDASYRDVRADRLTIGGRLLLPETDPAEFWDGNLWDSQPKGLLCFHEENMAGVSVNHLEYGFIEVSHHVKANRKYRVSTNTFMLDNTNSYYGRFRYTLGDNPSAPHTESPQLGNTWLHTSAGSNLQNHGDHMFTPTQDGLMRILLTVSRVGSTQGISFNNSTEYTTAQLRLEDLGPTRPYTGMPRNAGHGGAGTVRDPRPLVGGITTAWDMSWFQNYSHGGTQRRSSSGAVGGYGAVGLTQGMRQDSARVEGIWSSLFGFTTATESTNPADVGVSLAAALNGAEILSMHLEVTSSFAWQSNGNTRYVFWHHNHTTAPSQYSAAPGVLGDYLIRLGNRARIPLSVGQLGDLAQSGALTGFGIANATVTGPAYAGQLSWARPPRLVVTYQR